MRCCLRLLCAFRLAAAFGLFAVGWLVVASCSPSPIEPYGPVPTEAQLKWQRMEVNMFCHFGPNTFSGAEWGSGTEEATLFCPTQLDCNQWVEVASAAGMRGIILTAKHHDGFCLWPSSQSSHCVDSSMDVLRALRSAIDYHNSICRSTSLSPIEMGVYISPWDRNHPTYGTAAYNTVFANTLREVHAAYGPMFEQWFDGACGEGPNGKRQVYDWPLFEQAVSDLNPMCVMFSDVGPGCRWVGNEEGRADQTNWSTLALADGERHTEHGGCGDAPLDIEGNSPNAGSDGMPDSITLRWVPAEADVSIRPGWFWHADEHPKSVADLMEIYYNSVGRNALLLLNVPPDTMGRIPAEDSTTLVAFRAEIDRVFAHDLAQGAHVQAPHRRGYAAHYVLDTAYHSYWAAPSNECTLRIDLDSVCDFDIIVLQEYIPLGQRVDSVVLTLGQTDGISMQTTVRVPLCTTVGYKRIVRCPDGGRWRTNHLELHFCAEAPPVINRIALYNSSR